MRRLLLILWAVFFALVIYLFAIGSFFSGKGEIPANVWFPKPWMLLVFSLVLIFWTIGFLLTVVVRNIARRKG